MSFRAYLISMTLGTLAALVGWAYLLVTVNPRDAGFGDFVLFYLTLLVALVGVFAILGASVRVLLLRRRDMVIREVKISFRHALLLALVCVVSLFLSKQVVFHWWIPFVLIAIASVIEGISLALQRSRRG